MQLAPGDDGEREKSRRAGQERRVLQARGEVDRGEQQQHGDRDHGVFRARDAATETAVAAMFWLYLVGTVAGVVAYLVVGLTQG